ncbi:MAG TPA: fumarylacetoacetate hydrolase family protein [Miltoncostaeaceae bacterium]|nr:fumarylacetoacetate hydrolase family protein [Miltoncostaeaceae bacterium]
MRLVTFREPDGAVRVGALAGDEVRELAAPSMVAWLAGEGRSETGRAVPLAAVALLAPVPEPPSIRDFYAFEGHVAAGWRRRGAPIPEYWYRAPAFYFSNPAAVHGPGEAVRRPDWTSMLDFELEIAAVIDGDGAIAGFTLMNDWSARDVQRDEVTVLLGPHKSKDFATSLGPWLVTVDELPFDGRTLDLRAWVRVNGEEVGWSLSGCMHFSWAELVLSAARDTRLRAGDVLGSGTLEQGCLLELGPLGDGEWIRPGDVVEIGAEGLGSLVTPVV